MPLLVLAACGGGGGAPSPAATAALSPTPSPAAVELPEGFPTDFPMYEKATITAASRVAAAQGNIYAVAMETADPADAVRSFYEGMLGEAPWEVTNVVEIPEEDAIVVVFARRGGSGQAGTVVISREQEDGQRTLITISLPVGP